jgi:hypothetical protein
LAGSDKAERVADAAKAVRFSMRDRKNVQSVFAPRLRHGRSDNADAAVKPSGEPLANCCDALGENILSHNDTSSRTSARHKERDMPIVKSL